MSFGNEIRKNIAEISEEERLIFRDTIIKADLEKFYPDGVSFWDKIDQIHTISHIHDGDEFLPFHRYLLNEFEKLMQKEINSKFSLYYWDWNFDPRSLPDGRGGKVNLFTTGENGFIGNAHGSIGSPLDKLTNKGVFEGSREQTSRPSDPPQNITRNVGVGEIIVFSSDLLVQSEYHKDRAYGIFTNDVAGLTTQACDFIGGTIGGVDHKVFYDPFSLLIYCNVDRLWASWQLQKNKEWRKDPEEIYGKSAIELLKNFEPWAGGTTDPSKKIPPWGIQWERELINGKSPLIVNPPIYDKYAGIV